MRKRRTHCNKNDLQGKKRSSDLVWYDPHVVYDENAGITLKDQSKPGRSPKKSISDLICIIKAILSDDYLMNVLRSMPHKHQFKIWTVGLVSDQNKYIEVLENTIALSSKILDNPAEYIQKIDEIVGNLSRHQAAAINPSILHIQSSLDRIIVEAIASGELFSGTIGEITSKILQSVRTRPASSQISVYQSRMSPSPGARNKSAG